MIDKLLNRYKSMAVSAKATLWFLICAFLQKGISFITTPIFTRILNTDEYGQYNIFNSWLNILTVIFTLNLYSGVFSRGIVKFYEDKKAFISSMEGLTTTLVAVWMAVYLLFREYWNKWIGLSTVQMLLMLLLMWTTAVFSFWSMEQRVDLKYRKLVVLTICVSIFKPILSIVLVLCAHDKVTARIAGLVIIEFIAYVTLFLSHIRKGKKFCSKYYWKYALMFNIPLIPHYLSMSLLNGADRIMISNMVSESAAGIYSLAYSVSQIMVMFNSALMQTLEPWLYKKIKIGDIGNISRIAYPAFSLIALVNLLLIAFAPEVIAIFAPKEYYEAVWVIPPIAMSSFFTFSYAFFAAFEFYFEKTKYISIATFVAAGFNILLNYIFIKIYGYLAAGYTTLVSYIIYAMIHYVFMRCICKMYFHNQQPYDLKIILVISIAFMSIGFGFLMVYDSFILRYLFIFLIVLITVMLKKRIFRVARTIFETRKSTNK